MASSTSKPSAKPTVKPTAKPTAKPKKAARPATAAVKPAPKAAAPAKRSPHIPAPSVKAATPVAEAPLMGALEMKKQELIQKVVESSGAKKKDAKPVIEAVLAVLGEALADGRELNLQPLGKLKLNRTKETAHARIIVAKIRQSKGSKSSEMTQKDPLAAAAE